MRLIVMICLATASVAHAGGTKHIDVNLVGDPSELPSYVCVVSAERQQCGGTACAPTSGSIAGRRFVADEPIFDAKHVNKRVVIASPNETIVTIAKVINARTVELDSKVAKGKATIRLCACSMAIAEAVARDKARIELDDFKPDIEPDEAFQRVLAALALPRSTTSTLRCENPSVCPTSLEIARGEQFVQCVESETSKRRDDKNPRLVAVLSLHGSIQAISQLSFVGSRVRISFADTVFTVWIAAVGGSYAPGLGSTVLVTEASAATNQTFDAAIALERRCQPRTIELPRTDNVLPAATEIALDETGTNLYRCTPGRPIENRVLAQVPLGREGIVRSLTIRRREHGAQRWAAVASWVSRVPPVELRLAWTHFELTVQRDCVLPEPDAQAVHGCPSVKIAGAKSCTPTGRACTYRCEAVEGSAISTPTDVRFSFNGMEWAQPLEHAFTTLLARPPPDIRRLYFNTFSDSAYEVLLEGPRGFRQLVKRRFLPRQVGAPAWVSMPGLQCNDSIRYRYGGRYEHKSIPISLNDTSSLHLDPPSETFRLGIGAYAGGGIAFSLLDRGIPFVSVGGEIGKPFAEGWWGGHFAWRLGFELQFTRRPFESIAGSRNIDSADQSRWYQRQFLTGALGVRGVSTSPTSKWVNLWLRLFAGRGVAWYSEDDDAVKSNDFIWGLLGILEIPLTRNFMLEGYGGIFAGENVWRFETNFQGEAMQNPENGVRPAIGGHLKVTL